MGTLTTKLRRAASVVVLSSAIGSCFFSGFDRQEVAAGGTGGAGGVPAGGSGGDGGVVCEGITLPDPPAEPDAGGDLDFVVAIRSMDLGDGDEETLGFDLDAKCTCDPDGPSCQSNEEHCDAAGGVDNSAKQLFNLLASTLSNVDSEGITQQAEDGRWSILVRVRGYTGDPSDSEVRVDWYLASGFTDAEGSPATPTWNGSDLWPISSASLLANPRFDPNFSIYFDPNAYVVDGRLVAALPDSELRFAGTTSTMRLRITGGVLTADLAREGASYRLTNGVFAGRWREQDIFQSISSYRDEAGVGICATGPVYAALKGQFCNALDIPAALGGTASQPCKAVSLALGFEAWPVLLGTVFQVADELPYCVEDPDPAADSCAT